MFYILPIIKDARPSSSVGFPEKTQISNSQKFFANVSITQTLPDKKVIRDRFETKTILFIFVPQHLGR